MPTRVAPPNRTPSSSPRARRYPPDSLASAASEAPRARRAVDAAARWERDEEYDNVVDFDAARRRRFNRLKDEQLHQEQVALDDSAAPSEADDAWPKNRRAARLQRAGRSTRDQSTLDEEAKRDEGPPPCHWGLYVISLLLTILSIPLIYSASMAIALDHHGRADFFFFRQIGYVAIGAVVLVASSLTPAKWLRRVVWGIYALTLLGLLATDFSPLGLMSSGVRRWMKIGPVQLQFSELAKIALIGVMADFWSRAARFAPKAAAPWIVTAILALPIIGLVFVQPHLSAASLLFTLPLAIAFYAGVPWQRMARVGLCVVLMAGAAAPLMKPYQRERVFAHLSFLNKNADEQGSNYQALQGQRALAAGGLFGAGLGGGLYKQGHLPAPHTDFIASAIGEEWGLAGMVLLLASYGLMIFFCFHTGHCAASSFEALLCAGVGTLLGLQVIGNIGVVTGVLPVTGMPLPLLSYGGSGMICTLLGIGLVLSISRRYGSESRAV